MKNNSQPEERPTMNESGKFFVDATYDNADANCSRDDEIALLIESNCGEVRSRNDYCDNQRGIIGFFPGRFGAEKAVKALEALGIKAALRKDEEYDDSDFDDEEPESTFLAVEYNPTCLDSPGNVRSIVEKCGGMADRI